jgi:hypothetical protein
MNRIRQDLRDGKNSIAFFCPTKSFRNQFGNTPQLLRQAGYSAIQLYGERADDKFEEAIHSYQVSGTMVDNMDFIDAFVVPTVMDCLPNRSKKVLFNHNSFAGAGLEPPVAPQENLPENPSYDQLVEHYKHLLAFLPLYDYISISTPYVREQFEEIFSFYGKGQQQSPSSYAAKIVEGLYGHRMPETQAIIPCGYAPIDSVLRTNTQRRSSEKIITYAPTPMIGKEEWEPFASTRNHGGQIIQALLNSLPDYKVVFKPYPNEEPSLIKACIKHVINHPRFELQLSGESHADLYSRTSLLVTDFSSTGYTFALSYEKPVLFFSHNETNLPETVKYGPYCIHRNNIGAIAQTLGELPAKAKALLNESKQGSIISLRNEFLYNPGKSDQYFTDNIDYIINDTPHPDWNYYSPQRNKTYAKYKILDPANALLKPKTANTHPRDFQIVSVPMPCGVGWLVNILLELGIKTTHHGADYQDNHWATQDSQNLQINPNAKKQLQWYLPVLGKTDTFKFEAGKEVRWEHRLDFANRPEIPTILFTRDGRDAVYSQYRRHHQDSLSFDEFLERPDCWPQHFPDMFDLPPAETWALFNLYWIEMAQHAPIHVVRFEDTKSDPESVVSNVLKFLGVQRSTMTIRNAIDASSFQKSKEQEQRTSQESTEEMRGNHRKGQPYEWKNHYTEKQKQAFGGLANEALTRLRYEPVHENNHAGISYSKLKEIGAQTPLYSGKTNFQEPESILLDKALSTNDHNISLSYLSFRQAKIWTDLIFQDELGEPEAANSIRQFFSEILLRHAQCDVIKKLFFPYDPDPLQLLDNLLNHPAFKEIKTDFMNSFKSRNELREFAKGLLRCSKLLGWHLLPIIAELGIQHMINSVNGKQRSNWYQPLLITDLKILINSVKVIDLPENVRNELVRVWADCPKKAEDWLYLLQWIPDQSWPAMNEILVRPLLQTHSSCVHEH